MHQTASIAGLERGHKRSKLICTSPLMDYSTFSASHICQDLRSSAKVNDSMVTATKNQQQLEVPPPPAAIADAVDGSEDSKLMKGLSPYEVYRRERKPNFMWS